MITSRVFDSGAIISINYVHGEAIRLAFDMGRGDVLCGSGPESRKAS
jgi:hypothetical protein